MDRKQREDAINEVTIQFLLRNSLNPTMHSGSRTQGYETPVHHYIQGIFHGQEVSLHCDGLRRRWRFVHQNCESKENRKR